MIVFVRICSSFNIHALQNSLSLPIFLITEFGNIQISEPKIDIGNLLY